MYELDVSFLPIPDENQHDPKIGMQGWGYLPYTDSTLLEWITEIGRVYHIKTMLEIGTFAGYSAAMFLEKFEYLDKLVTIDPNNFSVGAGKALEDKYGDRVEYRQMKSGDLAKGQNYDLVFIDGNHTKDAPHNDILLAKSMNPKIIMMDNIELPDVQRAVKRNGLFDLKHDPEYLYYTSEHRGRRQPGILGVFNV